MHSSGLFIKSVIEKVRLLLDVSEADKYTDDILSRQFIPAAYASLWQWLTMCQDNQLIFRQSVSLVAQQATYILPPCVGSVVRFGKRNSTSGLIEADWRPQRDHSPFQRGWAIEGNELVLDPLPAANDTDWILWFEPSGDCNIHYGSGELTSTTTLTLASSPTLGMLDLRPNSYVGMVVRVLHDTSWQERVVSEYDVTTRQVTFRTALTDTGFALPETVLYEVAPLGYHTLWQCIAMAVALEVGAAINISEKKMTYIQALRDTHRKAIADKLGNLMQRRGKSFDPLTVDNPDYVYDPFR